MKKILTLILAFIVAVPVFAQYAPLTKKGSKILYNENGVQTSQNLDKVLGWDTYSSYVGAKKMYGWGVGLMIPGILVSGVGVAGVLYGAACTDPSEAKLNKRIGTDLLLIGLPVLAGGIVLFSIGNTRIKNIVGEYNFKASSDGVGISFVF